jgi:hypothetical protein
MCLYPRWAYIQKTKEFSILNKKVISKKINLKKQNSEVNKNHKNAVMIKCRVCEECIAERAREWSVRGYAESKEWTEKIFVTLSYNKENLPITKNKNPTLRKEDITKFKKRLRKFIKGKKIKTMECGEYGEKKGRPHYHMIIWGYKPKDLKKLKMNENKDWLYTSKEIEKIWGKGFIICGKIEAKTISYVARYTRKKIEEKRKIEDDEKENPYFNMSRHEGIGLKYWIKNKEKLKKQKNMIIHNGQKAIAVKLPKIYIKKWIEEENQQGQRIINRVLKNFDEEIKRIEIFKKTSLEEIKKIEKKYKNIGKVKGLKSKRILEIRIKKEELFKKALPKIREIMNCKRLNKEYEDELESEKYKAWIKEQAKKQYQERRKKTTMTEEEFDKHEKNLKIERLKKLKRRE